MAESKGATALKEAVTAAKSVPNIGDEVLYCLRDGTNAGQTRVAKVVNIAKDAEGNEKVVLTAFLGHPLDFSKGRAPLKVGDYMPPTQYIGVVDHDPAGAPGTWRSK